MVIDSRLLVSREFVVVGFGMLVIGCRSLLVVIVKVCVCVSCGYCQCWCGCGCGGNCPVFTVLVVVAVVVGIIVVWCRVLCWGPGWWLLFCGCGCRRVVVGRCSRLFPGLSLPVLCELLLSVCLCVVVVLVGWGCRGCG